SITIFIVSIGFTLGTKLNIVNDERLSDFWDLIIFILIDIALASVFTLIIIALANNFMKPVKKLIEATNKVSK
ncbi:hypothetical protein, partial [Terrisporobacter hibernicus]